MQKTYPVKIFFSFLFPTGDESLTPAPEADDVPVLVVISPSENKYVVSFNNLDKSTKSIFLQ